MKISAILQKDSTEQNNNFKELQNKFIANPNKINNKKISVEKQDKMGIETLENSSIFPKEVVNGRTIITA